MREFERKKGERGRKREGREGGERQGASDGETEGGIHTKMAEELILVMLAVSELHAEKNHNREAGDLLLPATQPSLMRLCTATTVIGPTRMEQRHPYHEELETYSDVFPLSFISHTVCKIPI